MSTSYRKNQLISRLKYKGEIYTGLIANIIKHTEKKALASKTYYMLRIFKDGDDSEDKVVLASLQELDRMIEQSKEGQN